ncbi:hypothetical protein AAMO2058_000093600 [Amorphochlora amoebiformis]
MGLRSGPIFRALRGRNLRHSQGKTLRYMSQSKAVNYDDFIRPHAKRREPSPIRALTPLLKLPGMISLGGGLPNPEMFPFKSLEFTLEDGTCLALKSSEIQDAFQYSNTPGLPALLEFLTSLQSSEHDKKDNDEWSVCVTTGSQEALSKAVDMLVGPEDTVIVDDPTYAGTLALMRPIGCTLAGVRCDHEGMVPEELARTLEEKKRLGVQPKVLYTVPTGQNPSGSTASDARKRAIYQIASEWNLLILEDDPYRFLYYGTDPHPGEEGEKEWERPKSQSMFSMDTEGRVIRFDSISKILSSGIRLGFATGPKELIDRINLHTQASNLHPSGVSQALCISLFNHWKLEGWEKHIKKVALYYMKRRDTFEALARKYLSEHAEWTTPSAGMFVWFKLHGIEDTQDLIQNKAKDANVLLLPGQAFSPTNEKSCYVRAAFSTATADDMEKALSRFAKLLVAAKDTNQSPS